MNWIYPLYICELLLFCVAFFLSNRDVMAPSVIMCAMFILSTTVAILAADHIDIIFGLKSFGILVAGISTYIFAEALFHQWFQRGMTRAVKEQRINEQQIQQFHAIHVSRLLIVFAIIIDASIVLWFLHDLFAVAGGFGGVVRRMLVQIVVTSWDDEILNPLLISLMKIVRALGYIAGFMLIQRVLAKEKSVFYTVCLLMMMILGQVQAAFTASRGGILQFLTALLVYYNILWHQKYGWHRNASWKLIRIGILCIVIGIPVFHYAVALMGRTALEDMRSMTEGTNIYLGYPIYLFDLYVKKPFPPIGFGEESLIGVNTFLSKYLGMDVFVRNTQLEYHYTNGYFLGNAYTFFRRPLHDFGFGGMLIFTILVAWLFSWIYYGKIKWRSRTVSADCWTIIYGYLFYWIVMSSLDQYSQNYVSLSTILNSLLMAVGYQLLNGIVITSVGIKYKKSRSGKIRI